MFKITTFFAFVSERKDHNTYMICATTTSVPQIGWHVFLKVATPINTLSKITYKTIVSCRFSSTSQDKSIHSLELYLDIPFKIIGQLHDFPLIVTSFSVFFHNLPMISNLVPMMFLYFTSFSHLVPLIFLWFSYDFPLIFLWFSYDFPMVFLWFSYDFPMISHIFPSLPLDFSQESWSSERPWWTPTCWRSPRWDAPRGPRRWTSAAANCCRTWPWDAGTINKLLWSINDGRWSLINQW